MRIFRGILAIAVIAAEFGHADESPEAPMAQNVSLVQVLANPEELAGKVITVAGFLNNRGTHLFLTREHRALDDYASAIYVCTDCDHDDSRDSFHVRHGCENRYVRMTGLLAETSDEMAKAVGPYWLISIYRIDRARNVEQQYWFHPHRTCWTNPNAKAFTENPYQ